eukprot:9519829-Prorocentrum_lima.AAC.1
MRAHKVDIALLQETHQGGNYTSQRARYQWFWSGGDERMTIHAGVAIVIRNESNNYVEDVLSLDNRSMAIRLRGDVPI